jgi:FAD/FMN-containing dehydrogenase
MNTVLIPHNKVAELKEKLKGEVLTDNFSRLLYATDASAYRQEPLMVVKPADIQDINSHQFCQKF